MKITNRQFARRPWDAGDNGMIRHFDGIHLIDPGSRGFYFCLHTAQGFLKQNNVTCEPAEGFSWIGLVLENFTVTGITGGEGVYITDGKDSHSVTIQNGQIVSVSADSKSIFLDHLILSTFILSNVQADGPVHFQNSEITKLIVRDCSNIQFTCNKCKVGSIELWNCHNVDVSTFGVAPTSFQASNVREDIRASFAINIVDGNVTYGLDVASAILKPRSPK